MEEIEELLQNHPSVHLGFEATVGGGTPILHTIQEYYNTDEVKAIRGIINGSTSYILSKMLLENVPYEDVYNEALRLGYLESDPNFDIKGLDARSKLIILSRLAFGVYRMSECIKNRRIHEDQVFCEGIQNIRLSDIQQLKQLGYHVKLVGTSLMTPMREMSSGVLIV